MNRRDAINRVGIILGGTIIGAEFFVSGCKFSDEKVKVKFTEEDVVFLNEVAETILPETSTPGAKSADVGRFMVVMVKDCYTPEDKEIFFKGMSLLDEESNKKYGKKFVAIEARQKHELFLRLDKEQKDYSKNKKPEDPAHYFRMMKELTLLGYFTSEIGCKKALHYVQIPGRYDGCIPYKKGDKSWAI